MEKGEVRPIGTEFDHCAWPTKCATGPSAFLVFTYRVIGHSTAQAMMGGALDPRSMSPIGAPYMVEDVEVVRVIEHPVSKYRFENGNIVPVPPDSVRHLL